jgi:hypothetical protein
MAHSVDVPESLAREVRLYVFRLRSFLLAAELDIVSERRTCLDSRRS